MKKGTFFIIIFSLTFNIFAEKIVFSANTMTGQAGNSNTTTNLSGNAYVKTETMEIQADELELSGEDYRFIKAQGHVVGKNLETAMDFSCDSLSYDRITKVAELKGNVDFKDTANEVSAQAQIIIYDQNDETAIMQIKVNLTQKDNVCSGSYAVYYKNEQLLELSGNAQIKQKEDVFRAQHISLDMDTQEITLGGNVKGTVTDSRPSKNAGQADGLSDDEENTSDAEEDADEGDGLNAQTDDISTEPDINEATDGESNE